MREFVMGESHTVYHGVHMEHLHSLDHTCTLHQPIGGHLTGIKVSLKWTSHRVGGVGDQNSACGNKQFCTGAMHALQG